MQFNPFMLIAMLFDSIMGWNIFVHADYTRGECADAFVCLSVEMFMITQETETCKISMTFNLAHSSAVPWSLLILVSKIQTSRIQGHQVQK